MVISKHILDWFRLINSNGVGVKTFWSLINYYGSASEAIKHIDNPLPENKAIKILSKNICNILTADDERFPELLKNSSHCPPILYYQGNINILNQDKIAIIGARNASLAGKTIAYKIAENLSNELVIVSGMAKGIDTSALKGALKSNSYSPLAVLPFGFDNIYPKENQILFNNIIENGLAITEVPPEKTPDQSMFRLRNKLIVLLSKGILVIEAAIKSGTMATANIALDLGREIMVVPGSPLDPRSFGSNILIKNGASLVQSSQDILDIINGYKNNYNSNTLYTQPLKANNISSYELLQNQILSNLSDIPTNIDDLHIATKVPIQQLLSAISFLELSGKVIKTSNNTLILKYES